MLLQAKILKRILLSYITTINHVNLSKVFIFGVGGEVVNSMLTRVLVNTKKRNQSNYKGVFASFKAIRRLIFGEYMGILALAVTRTM